MKQNRIVLGNELKACVNTAKRIDAEIGDFGHTPLGRAEFAQERRCKFSKLLAVPCALLLALAQIRLRLEKSIVEVRP